jgi:[ribosomal protein S18]-alanine N-acetyltransferase
MLNSSSFPKPETVRIRLATPADIPQMLELDRHVLFAAHWSTEQYDALFKSNAARRIVLVANDVGDASVILGFLVAICIPDDWEIESIVVNEAVQRRGVGSLLVRDLIARAKSAGVRALVLEVRESNVPARQLYEKHGFAPENLRKNYYQGPLEHALLYRLPLQSCDKIP